MKLSMSFLRQALPHSAVSLAESAVAPESSSQSKLEGMLSATKDCELSIDSRTIKPGQVYLALQGERVDGHQFVVQAVRSGARGVIINKDSLNCLDTLTEQERSSIFVISVRDTLQALIEMAKNWRQRFDYEVIGITGSVGKTTTKEMVKAILAEAGVSACVSYKNQNTIIGLCLNILKMKQSHNVAVFELGINEKGEMSALADILRPTKALVTTVAHSHTSHLGRLQDVAKEKLTIFKYFEPNNIGIICGDVPLLTQAYFSHPIVKFGTKVKNQVQARKIKIGEDENGEFVTTFMLKVYEHKTMITLQSNHEGRVYNALAAAAVAYFLEIPFEAIVHGLEKFTAVEGRFEMLNLKNGNGRLINDCYNANPMSMRAALLAFEKMTTKSTKIAVLGEMLELGEKESYWHRQIGRVLSRAMSVKRVILVGPRAKEIEKLHH